MGRPNPAGILLVIVLGLALALVLAACTGNDGPTESDLAREFRDDPYEDSRPGRMVDDVYTIDCDPGPPTPGKGDTLGWDLTELGGSSCEGGAYTLTIPTAGRPRFACQPPRQDRVVKCPLQALRPGQLYEFTLGKANNEKASGILNLTLSEKVCETKSERTVLLSAARAIAVFQCKGKDGRPYQTSVPFLQDNVRVYLMAQKR